MRATAVRCARHITTIRRLPASSCATYASPSRCRRITQPNFARSGPRRSFFNALFQKPPREVRQPEYEPGWKMIMVWRSRMLDNLRPPPQEELLRAYKMFIGAKTDSGLPLNSTQALQCRRLLEYLAKQPWEKGSNPGLSALRHCVSGTIAVLIGHEVLEKSQSHIDLINSLPKLGVLKLAENRWWLHQVRGLSRYGAPRQALKMYYSGMQKDLPESPAHAMQALQAVAEGLAEEGMEEELVQLMDDMASKGLEPDSIIQGIMVRFYSQRDRATETKAWFEKPISEDRPRIETYMALAAFARRNALEEYALPHFHELARSNPSKEYWNVLLFAILLLGKSLKEVQATMVHMMHGENKLTADAASINGLLEAAVQRHDPDLAQEILVLASLLGLSLDGESAMILLDLWLEVGQLPRAREVFQQIKYLDVSSWGAEKRQRCRRLLNKYLVSLCQQKPVNFDNLREVVEFVEENRIRINPETLSALCFQFLGIDEPMDVMDLLSVHSFLYSEAERDVVQRAFTDFCVDRNTSARRSWMGYQVLHQYFQDTTVERRVQLMQHFLRQKRPDMAVQILSQMRQHRNKSYHPTTDIYISFFENFPMGGDPESLGLAHNLLKTDVAVQPTVKLYTSLMIAYHACGENSSALDQWNHITASSGGPSYASLEIVFWVLAKEPSGFRQAHEIWAKIQRMDLEIPADVYVAYIAAVATGDTNGNAVRDLIENMTSLVGSPPNMMTLGTAYNYLTVRETRETFKQWAQGRYPEAWAELEKKGRKMAEGSLCNYKIRPKLHA